MTHIEIQNVGKMIHGSTVLKGINVSMHSGKIYGLQGINGSGKTMLMRLISGLIRPTEGKIEIDGKLLGKDITFPASIGLLLENPAFLDSYSGFQNLKMLSSIQQRIDDSQIKDTLVSVGLDPDSKKKYRKYSLGMKQRLGIAAAVMENPGIVILDEPTNSLDTSGVKLVKAILNMQKKRNALVVISCHDLSILQEMSDEIFLLEAGRIVNHMVLEKDN
ncbi:MAG TPA: multidrug ABC transporter ATP-binding protein [Clostridiaceae bacterium]|nr:multidrug ABC transporter ATP-binding protein [Clostridiaceae bacterium]